MSLIIKQIRSLKPTHLNRTYSSLFVPKSEYLSDDNLDSDYYCDKANIDEIMRNIQLRRSGELLKSLQQSADQSKWIREHIKLLPNRLHDKWRNVDVKTAEQFDKDQFPVDELGRKANFEFEAKKAEDMFGNFGILILGTKGLGTIGGTRSYLMLDDLVDLKNALIDYTLHKLTKKYKFNFVTVPNLLYNETVNACGFNLIGDRDLVYKLKSNGSSQSSDDLDKVSKRYNANQVCLSGTSEIPLAGLHFGEVIDLDQLPLRYCTVSRCYRKGKRLFSNFFLNR